MAQGATRPGTQLLNSENLQCVTDTFGSRATEGDDRVIGSGTDVIDEVSDHSVRGSAHMRSVMVQSIRNPGHVDIAPKEVVGVPELLAGLVPQAGVVEVHLRIHRSHCRCGITNHPGVGRRGDGLCDGRLLGLHDRRLLGSRRRAMVLIDKSAQFLGDDESLEPFAEVGGKCGLAGALATEDCDCGHPAFLPEPRDLAHEVVRDDGAVSHARAHIQMDSGEVAAFLTEARTVVLCTIGPDGAPDPVPMWFVIEGDELWMRTYAKSQKVRNIERDARVSLLVESGERYVELRGVQLTGPIELISDIDRICSVFAELMVKYEGLDRQFVADTADAYRETATKQVALRCAWTAPQWRVVSWDHRKQAQR